MTSHNTLRFDDGAVQFRQRIVCSILSNKSLLIKNIRNNDTDIIGLQAHEASFLRLIDQITNGTIIEINNSGTQLRFVPGILLGGNIVHDCPVIDKDEDPTLLELTNRSISWYLEGILPLAPFGKEALHITFTGITDGTCEIDPSCDYWKNTIINTIMPLFGIGVDIGDRDILSDTIPTLQIIKRGAAPTGGGKVILNCPIIKKQLNCIDLIDETYKIKRIRGIAISTKIISTSQTARIAYSAKGILQKLIPDIWIHTDAHTIKHHNCGPTPSLSIILTAETTNPNIKFCTECTLSQKQNNNNNNNNNTLRSNELPEDLGIRCSILLLEEIKRGGCIDTNVQSIILLWMCLSSEDVSRIRIGTLTSYTIQSLRLYKTAFGVEFKIKPNHTNKTNITLSCLGTGYTNMARAST